jgi:hypothetical protein
MIRNIYYIKYIDINYRGANLSKDVKRKKMEVAQKKEMKNKREKNGWAFI